MGYVHSRNGVVGLPEGSGMESGTCVCHRFGRMGRLQCGKGGYAENPGNPVAGLIQIGGGVLGLDINGGLGLAQPEIPRGRQPPAQIFQQYVFKGAAIEPF